MAPDLLRDDKCLACGKCIYTCPTSSISFRTGKNGNIEPLIDEQTCLNCGKCVIACNKKMRRSETIRTIHYVACSKDEMVRKGGASGGIFYELSKEVIGCGGIVFGAVFDAIKKRIVFDKCEKIEDIHRIRKSKYVQSDWTNCVGDIDRAVKEKRQILLSGLPCQMEAMIARYVSYENILFVDLFCHGVIGEQYFREYINGFSEEIGNIDFRGIQDGGLNNYTLKVYSENGNLLLCENYEQNTFYQCFVYGATLKDACYDCPYSTISHQADITLGDFSFSDKAHEIGFEIPNLSFVGVNTKKGCEYVNKISDRTKLTIINEEDYIVDYYPNHKEYTGPWGYNRDLRVLFKKSFQKTRDIKQALSSVFQNELNLVYDAYRKFGYGDIYLYGAGEIGRRTSGIIHMLFPGLIIKAFIVTEGKKIVERIDGIRVRGIDELLHDDKTPRIIVTVKERFRNEIVELLNEKGINDYVG